MTEELKLTKEQCITFLQTGEVDGISYRSWICVAKGVDGDDEMYTEILLEDIDNVLDDTYYDFRLWTRGVRRKRRLPTSTGILEIADELAPNCCPR